MAIGWDDKRQPAKRSLPLLSTRRRVREAQAEAALLGEARALCRGGNDGVNRWLVVSWSRGPDDTGTQQWGGEIRLPSWFRRILRRPAPPSDTVRAQP